MEPPPHPSLPDAGGIGFTLPVIVAVIMLMRQRLGVVIWGLWSDTVVGVLTLAAVSGALLIESVLESTGGSVAAVPTGLAYPLMDVLILGLLLGVFALTGWRPGRAWGLLALAGALPSARSGRMALENIGYQQIRSVWAIRGMWKYLRRNREWGAMTRKGFAVPAAPDEK